MRVLVVEDEPKMRALLHRGLHEHGYAVDVSANGVDGLWRAEQNCYDAIVLDVRLPDVDGFEVCRRMRESGRWVPVLMLTALDDVEARVRGLDVGADDYLVKPFDFAELVARLRALLRRGVRPRPVVLRLGDLSLDPATRRVCRGEEALSLTAKEFALLEYLLRHPEQMISRRRLAEHVWDEAFHGDLHVVNVYVNYLRNKIDRPFGRSSLQTIRGAGFRLRDDLAAAPG
jgi:two-component system OmpR family response regulator